MTDPGGPARIRSAFTDAASADRTALIAYVLAGFPTQTDALAAAEAALASGADLLEIGVPFSDPVADGPTIADAGRAALAGGAGLPSARRLVRALRDRGHDRPILVMSYLNPLLAAGEDATLRSLREAGADGLIVPDLPAGASPRLERLAASIGLAFSFLVAPNTPVERREAAIAASSGFLYVVPLLGVTGARKAVAAGALELISTIRRQAAGRVPVAAGFGVSSARQLAELGSAADGVIVGSALVAAVRDDGPEGVAALVRSLASATARPQPSAAARRVRS